MTRTLSLGYSPCPNDTFLFGALAEGRIDPSPLAFKIFMADVEVLNRKAGARELDVTKVSVSAAVHLLEDYWMLRAGGAMGRGCGPLVVSRTALSAGQLRHRSLAIPGKLTTANLLLRLEGSHQGPVLEMPFDQIMPRTVAGEVDAGLIIHEGRFTYPSMGLRSGPGSGFLVGIPLGCSSAPGGDPDPQRPGPGDCPDGRGKDSPEPEPRAESP